MKKVMNLDKNYLLSQRSMSLPFHQKVSDVLRDRITLQSLDRWLTRFPLPRIIFDFAHFSGKFIRYLFSNSSLNQIFVFLFIFIKFSLFNDYYIFSVSYKSIFKKTSTICRPKNSFNYIISDCVFQVYLLPAAYLPAFFDENARENDWIKK